MLRPARLLALPAVLALAGCGPAHHATSPFCEVGAGPVLRALRAAPATPRLHDGSTLSACISRATSAGDSQQVGSVFVLAAEQLEQTAGRDAASALELGYLIGATRLGAEHTNGVMAELVHRIELVGGRMMAGGSGPSRAALVRGTRIGQAQG